MDRGRVDDLEVGALDLAERVQVVVDQCGSGAPLMYQFDPLSATIIP